MTGLQTNRSTIKPLVDRLGGDFRQNNVFMAEAHRAGSSCRAPSFHIELG